MGSPNETFKFHPGRCFDCWDSTIVVTAEGPRRCADCIDCEGVSPQAERLAEVVWLRFEKKQAVDLRALNAARAIVTATREMPISGPTLQGMLRETERNIMGFVETLRQEWVLPIGSTRKTGYYWMRTAQDYLDWRRPYRRQAITSLATMYRIERVNFPELSGQESLPFIDQVRDELREALL